MSQVRLIIALAAIPFALWLFVPVVSNGQQLQRKIEQKRKQIESKKKRERVLTGTIEGYSRRIRVLERDITTLRTRQAAIEADLGRKRAELTTIQRDLRSERARITRLRARLLEARAALSERLVYLFKADEPDVVTVVLESEGFADLLQRTSFMQRVSQQDARIIDRARDAKADAEAAEKRLDRSEARQREVTAIVARRREEVAAIKGRLVERSSQYRDVRSNKREALVDTRTDRKAARRAPGGAREGGGPGSRAAGRQRRPRADPPGLRRSRAADPGAVHVAVWTALGTTARRHRRRRPRPVRRSARPPTGREVIR